MSAFREFWIVERDDHPGVDLPLNIEAGMTPRYFSLPQAMAAAESLARKYPNNGYVVLHAVGSVHAGPLPVEWSSPAPF